MNVYINTRFSLAVASPPRIVPTCNKCGAALSFGETSCPNCGAPAPAQEWGTQPTPWLDSLVLDPGESVVNTWSGDHEVPSIVMVNGRPQQGKSRKHGYLILTTRKLVFVEERGLFQKSYHVSVTILLEELEGISMGGLLMKYVSLSDEHGENIFHLEGVGNEELFQSFKQILEKQVEERRKEMQAEQEKGKILVNLDFGALRDYMEKGGLSMRTFKCPQCSAPLNLPDSGNAVRCSYCGSTVLAQDIMQKVKALIG
jgi:DNA-directed RNA polymerase subunit RPC12/RpoP